MKTSNETKLKLTNPHKKLSNTKLKYCLNVKTKIRKTNWKSKAIITLHANHSVHVIHQLHSSHADISYYMQLCYT